MLDELHDLQVFYINIGGGEPMIRRDFFELVEYSISQGIGVKFSTNGAFIDADKAAPAGGDGLSRHPDQPRRHRSRDQRRGARRRARTPPRSGPWTTSATPVSGRSRSRSSSPATTSISSTTSRRSRIRTVHSLRVTRLRPSGRGADTWHDLHPTNAQQRQIYEWLLAHGENVLTGDSFFHLNALGDENLPGLNLCGAGRVVCLIDPIGDVYACPFVIHDEFKAGNVRDAGRLRPGLEAQRAVRRTARTPVGRARARRAARTTRARAAAWPPSSSPACRSTAPTPSASAARASWRWPACRRCQACRRPSMDHSKPARSTPVAFIRK